MSRLIDNIASHMEVGSEDIRKFIIAAPLRYKVFAIPKRRGGERVIAQPSAALKIIQRYVVDTQLDTFPVHDAAAAYVAGRGIADNAARHRHSRYILKLDFENFFNSITVYDWRKLVDVTPGHGIASSDLVHFDRILFWGAGGFAPKILSVGAPSSPSLSNKIMYRFDAELVAHARQLGAVYTRYADDITISAQNADVCLQLEQIAQSTLHAQRSPRLRFKKEKRGLYGPGERRMVTGLIVTPDKRVSLGRERKRYISTLVHHSKLGKLDALQMIELKGLLGFVKGCEPSFLASLTTKYGAEVVQNILRFQTGREDLGGDA